MKIRVCVRRIRFGRIHNREDIVSREKEEEKEKQEEKEEEEEEEEEEAGERDYEEDAEEEIWFQGQMPAVF